MIRFIFIIIFITSCGNLPIAYIQNFSSVNNVIFGYKDFKITNDIFDSYEYSFIKVRFGRGAHSILILAYVNNDIYEWVGEDDVRIFTKNGRVIKTLGLNQNLEIKNSRNILLPESLNSYESVNLYSPDVYSVTMSSKFFSEDAQLEKLESKIEVNRIEEHFEISSIGWKETNYYFVNSSTNMVEETFQHIHPRLPLMKVEYYYKF